MDAALRQPADRIDRRDRGRARPIPTLFTSAAAPASSGPDLATGDGMYKSTDAGKTWTHLGAARHADDREHRGRSAQPESAVRRGARPSVRPERRARDLPLDRRRRDVREGALQGRVRQRQRRPHRSERSQHRLCLALAATAELHRRRRIRRQRAVERRRHLQVHRRRHDLEAADERLAGRAPGEPRDRAEQSEGDVRDGRVHRSVHAARRAARRRRGCRWRGGLAAAAAAVAAARSASSRPPTAAITGSSRPTIRASPKSSPRAFPRTSVRSAASAAAICRPSPSIRRTRTSSTAARPCSGARKTAA